MLRTEFFSSLPCAVKVAWLNLHAKDYRGLGRSRCVLSPKVGNFIDSVCMFKYTRTLPKVDKRHSARWNPTQQQNHPFSFDELRGGVVQLCSWASIDEGFDRRLNSFSGHLGQLCIDVLQVLLLWLRCYELYPSPVATSCAPWSRDFLRLRLRMDIDEWWYWRILVDIHLHPVMMDLKKTERAKSLAKCLKTWIWAHGSRKGTCFPTVS